MADAIAHRGPDGTGFLLHRDGTRMERLGAIDPDLARSGPPAKVGFAHLRLSILDLSHAADEPMVHGSGELALIFNGEIYNYVELRRELEDLGHEFRSTGDTEVLLAAYSEWGPGCVQRFVGMWSLAMVDLRREILF